MNFKKVFALAMVVAILCTAVVSVGAASADIAWNDGSGRRAAVANYQLAYNSKMNCVYATQTVTYASSVHSALRNLPGYIHLNVDMSSAIWVDWEVRYMTTSSNSNTAEFTLDFDIPAGETPAFVTANYSTNVLRVYNGTTYPTNSNFTNASYSTTMQIP